MLLLLVVGIKSYMVEVSTIGMMFTLNTMKISLLAHILKGGTHTVCDPIIVPFFLLRKESWLKYILENWPLLCIYVNLNQIQLVILTSGSRIGCRRNR